MYLSETHDWWLRTEIARQCYLRFVIETNEAALAAFKDVEAAGGSPDKCFAASAAVREAAWAGDDVPPKPPPHFPSDDEDPGATYRRLVARRGDPLTGAG